MAPLIVHPTVPPRPRKTVNQLVAEAHAKANDLTGYEEMLAEEYRAGDTLPDPTEGWGE